MLYDHKNETLKCMLSLSARRQSVIRGLLPSLIPTMSSIVLPSVSLQKISLSASESLKSCNSLSFTGFRHGIRSFYSKNLDKSRVSMSVLVGSQATVDDALFLDYKPSCAFLFPGQGAQAVGRGKEVQGVPAAADLYKKANDILGFDLLDVCTNGPKEKLDSTVISQPAIYVTSLAAVEVLRARDGGQQIIDSVDVTCGLSLGEYTALAFAGAFSFEDGLKLVKLRGEAMQVLIERLFHCAIVFKARLLTILLNGFPDFLRKQLMLLKVPWSVL
uniref:Malonyl-CoA:ACP transacylase (MAT) domain-containing protein n=1 Tax=Nelumbo nucifera TaxID=4432 RepID=A0A822Y5M0_NELNU|nr:TPA_asm: hypothetical protein HUJ06_027803 [Nelumbo nucifera]